MRQSLFEQTYQQEWSAFEAILETLECSNKKDTATDSSDFPRHYRRMCHHLALARERHYSSRLFDYLNQLVLRGHQQLYRRKGALHRHLIAFVLVDFPVLIRREWRYCLLALALLYVPALLMAWFVWQSPDLIYSLLSPMSVEQIEQMYSPTAEHLGRPRDAGGDFAMFGHYIQNNISISFRTFASGLLFGLGSIFFLTFNGVFFGGIAAHLGNLGYHINFFPFVIGHGAFELTAIAFSGAAGLKLGFALLAPGRRRRLDALREAAQVAIRMMYGVILMLVLAAFVEAFWSSIVVLGNSTKYYVGGLLWLGVGWYFLMAGRRYAA